MEQKKPISHIAAGAILAGILIVLSEVMMLTQGADATANRPVSSWLVYIIIIGGLVLFINLYAKANDHNVTFGNLFAYGFKITAVFAAIQVLYMLSFQFIHPEFKEKAIEVARAEMEKQGNTSDSQMDQAMQLMEKYFWVFAIGGSLLGNLVIGAIGSLIGAAITKKNPGQRQMQQRDQLDS